MVETKKAPKLLHGGRNLCCSVYFTPYSGQRKHGESRKILKLKPWGGVDSQHRELLGPWGRNLYSVFPCIRLRKLSCLGSNNTNREMKRESSLCCVDTWIVQFPARKTSWIHLLSYSTYTHSHIFQPQPTLSPCF
ncbi:hypothetical protein V6N12_036169 [Hibiscus sabdariffa]|uniref:Uncharacterized protein n=1 Tax=Hibiscus sabdariffa TaxID=183260 RepID=A0ABR2EPU6_9ROSI